MLSRVSYAAATCDEAISQYDFALATSTCYNLWLYDLCDIYLVSNNGFFLMLWDMEKQFFSNNNLRVQEYLKPIFQSEDNVAKLAAQKVLFITLDVGLRLLSPFMPFITEELYQRLPRKRLIYPSICLSPYPDGTKVGVEHIYNCYSDTRLKCQCYSI